MGNRNIKNHRRNPPETTAIQFPAPHHQSKQHLLGCGLPARPIIEYGNHTSRKHTACSKATLTTAHDYDTAAIVSPQQSIIVNDGAFIEVGMLSAGRGPPDAKQILVKRNAALSEECDSTSFQSEGTVRRDLLANATTFTTSPEESRIIGVNSANTHTNSTQHQVQRSANPKLNNVGLVGRSAQERAIVEYNSNSAELRKIVDLELFEYDAQSAHFDMRPITSNMNHAKSIVSLSSNGVEKTHSVTIAPAFVFAFQPRSYWSQVYSLITSFPVNQLPQDPNLLLENDPRKTVSINFFLPSCRTGSTSSRSICALLLPT